MTIAQVEEFYKYDTKDYEIKNNKEFLNWLNNVTENGYHAFIKTNDIQQLIDIIVVWYEFKYLEKNCNGYFDGKRCLTSQDINKLSRQMTIDQLLSRLSNQYRFLMECRYRAKGGYFIPIYDKNGEINESRHIISMSIFKKNEGCDVSGGLPFFYLNADSETGEILECSYYDLEEYINVKEKITLNELLTIFETEHNNELDFTELRENIYDYNCDIELRRRVLQLVALKLLYSRNTTPERGYERAIKFINEFNKKNEFMLSTYQVDEIFHRDYNDVRNDVDGEKNDEKNVNETQPKMFSGIKKVLNIFVARK